VVIEPGIEALLKPKVKVFYSMSTKTQIPLEIIDLAESECKLTIEGPENPEEWGFKSLENLWL
jgi:hypothetical protein